MKLDNDEFRFVLPFVCYSYSTKQNKTKQNKIKQVDKWTAPLKKKIGILFDSIMFNTFFYLFYFLRKTIFHLGLNWFQFLN